MNNYVIITDSSCDLPQNMIAELDITVIPLLFTIKGKEYADHADERDLPTKEFYSMLRSGETATTSAVNMGTFIETAEPFLKNGKDVLFLAFSSGLSNTCNACMLAVNDLSEKYPERKIRAADTLAASMGQGLLVYYAAKMRLDGKDMDEVYNWVTDNRLRACHWFTVDDLNHLKRGGRISSATALVGTMLGIKPVLHVDDEGHLINVGKVRGRQASLKALVDKMEELVEAPQEQVVFISHGDCEDDAKAVAQMIRQRMQIKDIYIHFIGPVIGTHAGPGTVALFFLGNKR